ncbi:MAG: 50S ribosomal protein L19 [Planctomycetes bacterium]|nr:50S ribosomal protein L19 [Planctomycetota bacterium]
MNRKLIEEVEARLMRKLDEFRIGDTVDVGVRIREGEKERVQVFNGTVIGMRGSGARQSFTVRRIVQGEGVERIFPFSSPALVSVKVKRRGDVRRAKLFYLRERVGKATRVKERIWSKEEEAAAQGVEALPAQPKARKRGKKGKKAAAAAAAATAAAADTKAPV